MAGCTIKCSNIFGGEDGKMIVSPLEYETIGLMGSNLGISSLDAIARMNCEVNDLGLDSIEIGAALGVAAEAGLLQWGDCEGMRLILGFVPGRVGRTGQLCGGHGRNTTDRARSSVKPCRRTNRGQSREQE
jgi:aldehyde:ferredoxin oxidoreductase